ncbi:MAG: hypothetical protein H0X13_15550 [Ramlibacter sp.]|nr:hypothetical protein [Ramlibacter sp.]
MESYLTEAELASIQHLHKRAPFVVQGISHGMFSIARHYGGMTFQGESYAYNPPTDECIRNDVLLAVEKLRRKDDLAALEQKEQP